MDVSQTPVLTMGHVSIKHLDTSVSVFQATLDKTAELAFVHLDSLDQTVT